MEYDQILLENYQDRNFFIKIKTIRTERSKRFLFFRENAKGLLENIKGFSLF